MEARFTWSIKWTRAVVCLLVIAITATAAPSASAQIFSRQREFAVRSPNFIVFASSPQWAQTVAQAAEQYRRDLAIKWLGEELPQWPAACPLHVHTSPQMQASGETRFALRSGVPVDLQMIVNGTKERVLDSVLPHEITHTVFATHFAPMGKYVPRWADEGACTTVEHSSEKNKHIFHLNRFLRSGKGIPFNVLFSLKEYPDEILPLYAQGHSVVQFLLDQAGPREFVKFLETGMPREQWEMAIAKHYKYSTLGELQAQWNQWLADGSPENLVAYAPLLRQAAPSGDVLLASNLGEPSGNAGPSQSVEGKSNGPFRTAVGGTKPAPVQLAAQTASDSQVLGNSSWYQRKLDEVSGGPATPVPAHNTKPRGQGKLQSTARPPSRGSAGTPLTTGQFPLYR